MESDPTAALIKHSDSSAAVQDDKGSTSNPSVTLDGLLTRKWLVMGLVAALSFGSDFSGYFISASVDTCEGHLPGLAAGYSISLFLGGNVLSSVFVANLFERLGIQSSLTFASLLLFVGNGLKSGIPFLNNELDPSPVSMIYAGSFICGLSQPIFRVCDLEVISFWPERQEYLSAISSAGLFGVSFAYLMNSLDCYQIFSIATLGAAALLLAVVTILPQPVAISAVPCSSHSHQRTRRAGGPARAFRTLLPPPPLPRWLLRAPAWAGCTWRLGRPGMVLEIVLWLVPAPLQQLLLLHLWLVWLQQILCSPPRLATFSCR